MPTLPKKYIKTYYFPGMDIADLKQEILLALYKASLYFNPQKGVKFTTYVAQTCRFRIINLMRDSSLRIHPQNDGRFYRCSTRGRGENIH